MSPIDVFTIDKAQLWEWAGWQGCWCDCMGVQNQADSLRKGSYLVVSNYAWFGGMQVRPVVWERFGSLRAALSYIDEITDGLGHNYRGYGGCGVNGMGYAEEYEIWHVVEGAYSHMVPDSPATVEVYDVQASAFCDLCELGEEEYPYAGLGSFGNFCPLDCGGYVLVDQIDGGQPFMIYASDSLDTLKEMAETRQTKDGKRVSWEIWHVVPDQQETAPAYDSPENQARIAAEVEDLETDLFILHVYLDALKHDPSAFESVVAEMAAV